MYDQLPAREDPEAVGRRPEPPFCGRHPGYQQYRRHLGVYDPLEMLQQGYGPVPRPPAPEEGPKQPPPKRPSPEEPSLKKPKPQKKKKKRDPNEPQKPVSAYALFFRDTQAAIKGQNPNASFGEVSKIVASMWDTLDVEHKNLYKRKTEDAKKDYLKALAAYRASLVSKGAREPEAAPAPQSPYPPGSFAPAPCYNGYSQHGYSPPKPEQTLHHHGYTQTPDSRLGNPFDRRPPLHHPYTEQPDNNSYASSPGAPAPFNDAQARDRNQRHYHGYSPPRSMAAEQPRQQYVHRPHRYSDAGIGDEARNAQQGGGYVQDGMRNVPRHHQPYGQQGPPQQQQAPQPHHGYSSSPGASTQQESSSQTPSYPTSNQGSEPRLQMPTANAYTQSSNVNELQHRQSQAYPSPSQSSGYSSQSPAEQHQVYPPTSSVVVDQHGRLTYSSAQAGSPYNGYSTHMTSSFDSYASGSPSQQQQQQQQQQPLMSSECVQSQQQSQVLVGRHMAQPGGQHMPPVHQPPPL